MKRDISYLVATVFWCFFAVNSAAWGIINSLLHNDFTALVNMLATCVSLGLVALYLHSYIDPDYKP